MRIPHRRSRVVRALRSPCLALLALAACSRGSEDSGYADRIPLHAPRDLVESSAAAMSPDQPDVFFTINDSGNDPVLYAVDTTGADRGAWRIARARNVDWEAASLGPCGDSRDDASHCVYIGDVGDNEARHATRTIYRVPEPRAGSRGDRGTLTAERLVFRYDAGPRDVEAMYVAPDGAVVLVSKRPLRDRAGRLRPALVFRLPADAWTRGDTATAALVDSIPVVPGSASMRTITDAALSPDGRRLAVRTYGELFLIDVDSVTAMAHYESHLSTCDVSGVDQLVGEGVTWLDARRVLLTGEGRGTAVYVVECGMPNGQRAPLSRAGRARTLGSRPSALG